MAKATFVKKARKNYKEHGIKKGESYYWWKFRKGPKHYSKVPPRPSQLTQSDFLSQAYALAERIEDLSPFNFSSVGELEDEVKEIAEAFRDLGQEQLDKKDNMPEQLQESETGELLQERSDRCEEIASELESLSFDEASEDEDEDSDEENEAVSNAINQVQEVDTEVN